MDREAKGGGMTERNLEIESVKTAIGRLETGQGIANRFHVSVELVNELTASGFMPHSRVKGIDEPLFSANEAKDWIAANLVEHVKGQKLPPRQILVIPDDNGTKSHAVGAPSAIASVVGLRQFHPDLFCGVYFLCLKNEVVYVGQSINVPARVSTHNAENTKQFDKVFFLRVPKSELLAAEAQFIDALKPKLNWEREQPVSLETKDGPLSRQQQGQ